MVNRHSYYDELDPLDKYVEEVASKEPAILQELRAYTVKNVPYAIMVSDAMSTQMITLLLKMINAKKCLEVGAFTGYNALSCAITIPEDGKVYALDINEDYVKHGYPFFEKAGVRDKLQVIIGPAIESMDTLKKDHTGTFDFVYIDAHKPEYKDYVERAHALLQQGGIIVLDNMLHCGQVAELDKLPESRKESPKALDKLNRQLRDDQRFDSVLLNMADGITILRKL